MEILKNVVSPPAVVAAIIAFICVIINLLVTNSIAKRSENIQREIAKDNIDANIRRKNKLEHIDNIRAHSAELIANLLHLQFNSNHLLTVCQRQKSNSLLDHSIENAENEAEYKMDIENMNKLREDVSNATKEFKTIKRESFISISKLQLLISNERTNKDVIKSLILLISLCDRLENYLYESINSIYDENLSAEDLEEFINTVDSCFSKNLDNLKSNIQEYLEREYSNIVKLKN